MPPEKKGIAMTALSAVIFGLIPSLCEMTYRLGNDPITLSFFKSTFTVPFCGIAMLRNGVSFRISMQQMIRLALAAIFSNVLTTILLFSSYTIINASTATAIHFMYPLIVALICRFSYHEKITRSQAVSLFIAAVGIMFFANLHDMQKLAGIIFALLSGITYAIYLVIIDKMKLSSINGYKLAFYLSLDAAVAFLGMNWFTGNIVFLQTVESNAVMVIISLADSLLALYLLKEGIKILGSKKASILSMLEPLSAMLFGYLLNHQAVSRKEIIGSAIVILSVILMGRETQPS